MKIRLSIVQDMFQNTPLQKAVAFSMYIKSQVVSSSVPFYTVNKLRSITGMSAGAIKKRLETLFAYGLAKETGINNNCIVFCRLKSSSSHRNAAFKELSLPEKGKKFSIRDYEKYVRAILIMTIQVRKDYARHFSSVDDVHSLKELKERHQVSKNYGFECEYNERGLSYKGIASRLGVSLRTAFDSVSFAINQKLLKKQRHIIQILLKGAKRLFYSFTELYDNVFCTNNSIYLCYANTYTLM